MSERPYVLVSCAMSVDGHIDGRGPARLILSSDADLDRVDEVRAGCDAIMVGASTIRRDDPRLVIRSPQRRSRRMAAGLPEDPVKVTVTATGDLPASAAFFTAGSSPRLVYCARAGLGLARARLSGLAEVIDAGDSPSPARILDDLAVRRCARLLLEGGGVLASSFLAAGLVDELHLVVAPVFVGDPAAPRFAGAGVNPHDPSHRMRLAEVRQLGDVVLLRYLLAAQPPEAEPAEAAGSVGELAAAAGRLLGQLAGPAAGPAEERILLLRGMIERLEAERFEPARTAGPPGSAPGEPAGRGPAGPSGDPPAGGPGSPAGVDVHWLRAAIGLSRRCPPSRAAFSVGAVIVAADGTPLATGFSRERDLRDHAEEVALARVRPGDPRLAGATLYSSLEPCGVRASRPRPCADLIIAAGIPRVVYAWHEPPLLAAGGGAEMLRAAGVTVTEVSGLAAEAREVNSHLIRPTSPAQPGEPPASS